MMAKPMKTLELNYPMIQFLIMEIIQCLSAYQCLSRPQTVISALQYHEKCIKTTCYKSHQQNGTHVVINNPCRINAIGANICQSCGTVNGYQTAKEFIHFYEN